MKRSLLFVALTVVVSGGCKKYRSNDDSSAPQGNSGGSGNPGTNGLHQVSYPQSEF